MPYVEGFGTWPFGEEWLWEAIATSYLPLLDVLDAHPGKVTLSITPVLADQLEAPGALERCLAFLREVRPASHGLDAVDHPEAAAQIAYSAARYESAAEALERRGDLIAAFAPHVTWTSAATHAVLPLLATDAGVRLQLETGIASHRRRFGAWDGGFWLPECAHAPWLDELLEEAGVHMTCVDWTDVTPSHAAAGAARPASSSSRSTAPRSTACGTRRGYPSHGDYRDSHRLTAARARAVGQRRHAVRPRARRRAGARRRRGLRRARRRTARSSPSTPSSSATTGTRASRSCEAVLELADVVAARASTTAEPAPRRAADELGRWRATCARGAAASWPGRSAAPSWPRSARSRPPRALRELLALQSSDWAFLIDARHRRRLPARAGRSAPRGVRCRHWPDKVPTNCGIWLHSWRIGRSCSPEAQVRARTLPMFGVRRRVQWSPS